MIWKVCINEALMVNIMVMLKSFYLRMPNLFAKWMKNGFTNSLIKIYGTGRRAISANSSIDPLGSLIYAKVAKVFMPMSC